MVGAASSIGFHVGWPFGNHHMPLTRYCVEMEDVELKGIVTDITSENTTTRHFSDYNSCGRGNCRCMVWVDRTWARLPKEQIMRMCPRRFDALLRHRPHRRRRRPRPHHKGHGRCRCPKQMDVQSRKYVGRAPLPLPIMIERDGSLEQYPLPTVASPRGHLLHFPAATRCKLGAPVGTEGCTWRLSSFSHTLYFDDLLKMGANASYKRDNHRLTVPYNASMHNIGVVAQALKQMPVDVPKCGSGADAHSADHLVSSILL